MSATSQVQLRCFSCLHVVHPHPFVPTLSQFPSHSSMRNYPPVYLPSSPPIKHIVANLTPNWPTVPPHPPTTRSTCGLPGVAAECALSTNERCGESRQTGAVVQGHFFLVFRSLWHSAPTELVLTELPILTDLAVCLSASSSYWLN
jgi:hypothetical protein